MIYLKVQQFSIAIHVEIPLRLWQVADFQMNLLEPSIFFLCKKEMKITKAFTLSKRYNFVDCISTLKRVPFAMFVFFFSLDLTLRWNKMKQKYPFHWQMSVCYASFSLWNIVIHIYWERDKDRKSSQRPTFNAIQKPTLPFSTSTSLGMLLLLCPQITSMIEREWKKKIGCGQRTQRKMIKPFTIESKNMSSIGKWFGKIFICVDCQFDRIGVVKLNANRKNGMSGSGFGM